MAVTKKRREPRPDEKARKLPAQFEAWIQGQILASRARVPGPRAVSDAEFTKMVREMIRQNFPLNRLGLNMLNRSTFEFRPGEPGWAGSWGRGHAGLGAGAEIPALIHEWTHSAEKMLGQMGMRRFQPRGAAGYMEPIEQLLRAAPGLNVSQGQWDIPALQRDPAHLYNIPLTELSGPLPRNIQQQAYPFIRPGAGPAQYLRQAQRAPAFPGLLAADVAGNVSAYRQLAGRDPAFFRDLISRAPLAAPGQLRKIIPTRSETGFGAMPQTRPRPLVRDRIALDRQAKGKGK